MLRTGLSHTPLSTPPLLVRAIAATLSTRLTRPSRAHIARASAFGFVWLVGVGALDYHTGEEVSFSVFYIPAILYVAWTVGRAAGVGAALMSAAIWLTVELHTHAPFSHPFIPWWNALSRCIIFLGVVEFARVLREQQAHLQRVVDRQTDKLQAEAERRRELEREMAELAARQQAQLARDFHDGVGQYLSGLGFRAHILADELTRSHSPQAPEARRLIELIALANREARLLTQVHDVRRESDDLPAALRRLVEDMQTLFGVTCEADLPAQPLALPPRYADTLYRIAQEALSNAVKHAGRTRIQISLTPVDGEWQLTICDTGTGLPPDPACGDGAGLKIMRYRAELIGARLAFRNAASGGCVVECRFPASLAAPAAERP